MVLRNADDSLESSAGTLLAKRATSLLAVAAASIPRWAECHSTLGH